MHDVAQAVYIIKGVLFIGAVLGFWALYYPYRRR